MWCCRNTHVLAATRKLINVSHRNFTSAPTKQLHVCVVGSGPSGFYATESILSSIPNATVTIYERLPVPFGLVRFGVAPDHPEVKLVQKKFEKLLSDNTNGCYFVGNVQVGKDITIDELRRHYHAIILAYGAEGEKYLGIPGERLAGVYSARDFVSWLNGHPDFQNHKFDLQHRCVGIIGQGNVALDAARILLRDVKELQVTDMTAKALDVLRNSAVEEVHILGRRGPAQAAFTTKELRELLGLSNVSIHIADTSSAELNEASKSEIADDRAKRRMVELLGKLNPPVTSAPDKQKKLYFHFLRSPVEFLSKDGNNLSSIRLEVTELTGNAGTQNSIGTGKFEDLSCGIAFRSIGYKSMAMPVCRGSPNHLLPTLKKWAALQTNLPIIGVPFDKHKGIVPNQQGRATETNGGLYVCGWLKRGPSGIIATNKWDAEETVNKVAEDWKSGVLQQDIELLEINKLKEIIQSKGLKAVTFSEWKKIEAEEVKRGKERGKVMEKFTVVEDMLNVLK